MPKDIVAELSNFYFKRTGPSPDMSFYSWLDSMGIEPDAEAWQDVIDRPYKYFEEDK